MTLDRYTLGIFAAGLLAGAAITILASLAPDLRMVLDDYRRFVRSRRRPPPEPRPLEHGRK